MHMGIHKSSMITRLNISFLKGERFASPIKQGLREKHSKLREESKLLSLPSSPRESDNTPTSKVSSSLQPCSVATAEEVLLDSVVVNELPTLDNDTAADDSDTNVNTTLLLYKSEQWSLEQWYVRTYLTPHLTEASAI